MMVEFALKIYEFILWTFRSSCSYKEFANVVAQTVDYTNKTEHLYVPCIEDQHPRSFKATGCKHCCYAGKKILLRSDRSWFVDTC